MSMTYKVGRVFPGELTPDQISQTPVLVRGEGVYVFDETGKKYLDAVAGIAVVSVGYGREEVVEAMARQARELPYCISNIFANEPSQALARRLAELTPGDLNQVHFVSGGSEAVETAIKLARQYHLENGQPDRYMVIARRQSYHGATLGALSATGSPQELSPRAARPRVVAGGFFGRISHFWCASVSPLPALFASAIASSSKLERLCSTVSREFVILPPLC